MNGENLKGAWPAIWMLGHDPVTDWDWPHNGEIDIVELANGDPSIIMTTHSTNHFGADGQHPPSQPLNINADFTVDPLICGMEWNVQEDIGQIDLTWWFTYFDLGNFSISQPLVSSYH